MATAPSLAGRVVAVCLSPDHGFSKQPRDTIAIRAGFGVVGDAHAGERVQHLSRVKVDPAQPNLRQVHLIHGELLGELQEAGFPVEPGQLGENILTDGLDLLALPRGAILRIGDTAALQVTGLRNPCGQIESFRKGLLAAVLVKAPGGRVTRKSGVMAVAIASGRVSTGDAIRVQMPDPPYCPLGVV